MRLSEALRRGWWVRRLKGSASTRVVLLWFDGSVETWFQWSTQDRGITKDETAVSRGHDTKTGQSHCEGTSGGTMAASHASSPADTICTCNGHPTFACGSTERRLRTSRRREPLESNPTSLVPCFQLLPQALGQGNEPTLGWRHPSLLQRCPPTDQMDREPHTWALRHGEDTQGPRIVSTTMRPVRPAVLIFEDGETARVTAPNKTGCRVR